MSSSTARVSTSGGSTPKPAQTGNQPKTSQQEKPPPSTTAAPPEPTPQPKQSVTVVSVVEATDSFIALEPAPTDSPPQSSPSPSQQPSSQAPQQTSSAAPPSTKARTTSSLISERTTPIPASTHSETTFSTSTHSSSLSSIPSSSSASPSPSLVPLGNPFQGSSDSTHHGKNKSGPTIAGVVGGLSAAILLGVLGFFLWKWKTRGKYGANKRQSFGPYGNGIDANRGGLLVSSVACKPGDSISNHEESLYSDENSPTRYDRPSFDANKNREPTLPKIGDMPDRAFMPSSPPKTATFGIDQAVSSKYPGHPSYRPGDPMMAVAGIGALTAGAGVMAAAHHRSPMRSHGGVLYQPRRPPVPPSMRRNRTPPHPPGLGGYGEGDYLNQGIPRSNSMGHQPAFNRSMPHLNGGYGPPPPGLMPGRMPPMRQVRRSASLSGLDGSSNSRYPPNSSPFDPLSMHPVIPEVPSGPTTPIPKEMPAELSPMNNITRSPVELHRRPVPQSSGSLNGSGPAPTPSVPPPRPPIQRWSTAASELDKPKILTVRNPSPEPDKEDKKKEKGSGSPIGSIVRRVSNMGKEKEHTIKPSDAAKNF